MEKNKATEKPKLIEKVKKNIKISEKNIYRNFEKINKKNLEPEESDKLYADIIKFSCRDTNDKIRLEKLKGKEPELNKKDRLVKRLENKIYNKQFDQRYHQLCDKILIFEKNKYEKQKRNEKIKKFIYTTMLVLMLTGDSNTANNKINRYEVTDLDQDDSTEDEVKKANINKKEKSFSKQELGEIKKIEKYTVKSGDYINKIAKEIFNKEQEIILSNYNSFESFLDSIVSQNGGDLIYKNQVLEINLTSDKEDFKPFVNGDKIKPKKAINSKTLMDYRTITDKTTAQYNLQKNYSFTEKNPNSIYKGLRFSETKDGQKLLNVALGSGFGEVGTRVKIYFEDESYTDAIIGEQKDDEHTDKTNTYHAKDGSVMETIVDLNVLGEEKKSLKDIFPEKVLYIIPDKNGVINFKGNLINKNEKQESIIGYHTQPGDTRDQLNRYFGNVSELNPQLGKYNIGEELPEQDLKVAIYPDKNK